MRNRVYVTVGRPSIGNVRQSVSSIGSSDGERGLLLSARQAVEISSVLQAPRRRSVANAGSPSCREPTDEAQHRLVDDKNTSRNRLYVC